MCSWWPSGIFPLMGLLEESRRTFNGHGSSKRVRMGWPAKSKMNNMSVHSCGLQKAWCVKLWSAQGLVGQWVGCLGKASGRTTSQMPEDSGHMQKQQLHCFFVRYSGDRPVAVQVCQRGPRATSIRFTIFMILAAECTCVHRHGEQDSDLADIHSNCNDRQTIF